jgi:hypothetical protein
MINSHHMRSSKPVQLAALLALLIPSVLSLRHNADVPQLGERHDDGLYYASAKSLAEGHYRIESLPGKPAQTKYPPLYPLLLSLAWRVNPAFPQNLPIAAGLTWLALPALLAALWRYYPRIGISGWRMWLLLALLAVNPYIILFSVTLFSELWFTALLIGVLLLVEDAARTGSHPAFAAAAGVLAGLAYLTRTAGIVLLLTGAVYLWARRERAKALWFGAGMLPFVAGWTVWVRLHQLQTNDESLVYYVDYVKYEFYNVHLNNLHLVVWKNVDAWLWGMGSLMVPKVSQSFAVKVLAIVIAAAMISGVVRMVRKGAALHYAAFAAATAFMLVIWHFPPNERFSLPLAPLAFAGLLTELEHFSAMTRAGLRHVDRSQRVAAAIMAGLAAVIVAGALALQLYVSGVFLDETARGQRAGNLEQAGDYAWIRGHLPPDAVLIAYDDPVMYLYTGRPAMRLPMPPRIWYNADHDGEVELYRGLVPYARQHGASYVYSATSDLRNDMPEEGAAAIEQVIRTNPGLAPIYKSAGGIVYELRGGEGGL